MTYIGMAMLTASMLVTATLLWVCWKQRDAIRQMKVLLRRLEWVDDSHDSRNQWRGFCVICGGSDPVLVPPTDPRSGHSAACGLHALLTWSLHE